MNYLEAVLNRDSALALIVRKLEEVQQQERKIDTITAWMSDAQDTTVRLSYRNLKAHAEAERDLNWSAIQGVVAGIIACQPGGQPYGPLGFSYEVVETAASVRSYLEDCK